MMKKSHLTLTILFSLVNLVLNTSTLKAETSPYQQLAIKNNHLSVRIKSPLRCMFGDFDAILQDQMHAKEHNEIILEIVSADRKYRKFRQILPYLWTKDINKQSKDAFELHRAIRSLVQKMNKRGELVEFELPKNNTPTSYQIKICKNSDLKSRTCDGKKVRKVNDMLKQYEHKKETKKEPADNVYFSQIFSYDGKNLSFIKSNLTEALYDDAVSKSEFSDAVKKNMGITDSLALSQTKAGELLVQLPAVDKGKCN